MNKTQQLLAIALITLAPATAAAVKYELNAKATTTQVSGTSAEKTKKIGGDGNFKALYELTFWEQVDEPCAIQSRSRHVNTLSTDSAKWDECHETNKSKKTIAFSNTDTFIRGIQVCQSSGNEVKGVKIFGAKLNRSTGALENVSGSKSFERPNCNDNWRTAHYCPVGSVASKLVIKYDYGARARAKGLALECRHVDRK